MNDPAAAAALDEMVRRETQWRADVIELLTQIAGYAQAAAEAEHAHLAALAEIRGLLRTEPAEDDPEGEPASVADWLEALAADVDEIGRAANLLSEDPDE